MSKISSSCKVVVFWSTFFQVFASSLLNHAVCKKNPNFRLNVNLGTRTPFPLPCSFWPTTSSSSPSNRRQQLHLLATPFYCIQISCSPRECIALLMISQKWSSLAKKICSAWRHTRAASLGVQGGVKPIRTAANSSASIGHLLQMLRAETGSRNGTRTWGMVRVAVLRLAKVICVIKFEKCLQRPCFPDLF